MDDQEQENLSDFLKRHGLSPNKWVPSFHKVDITKPDQILAIKGEYDKYKSLSSNANETEQQILRQLFNIADTEIEHELHHAGLEPRRWLPIFKTQLGVTSLRALSYIGSESYGDLQRFAKPWEKKALREFLGIDDALKLQREEQKEKSRKRYEDAQQLLQQLKEFQKEGKDRHDNTVKETENGIREALQISPDSWIPHDTSLAIATGHLEAYVGELTGTFTPREDLVGVSVLQHASGGSALQGILLSQNIDDQFQNRGKMLRSPDNIQLRGPSLSQCDKIEEFSSKYQEDLFTKSMEKLGYSATASAASPIVGFWGFSAEGRSSYSKTSEEEAEAKHHKKIRYSSTVKYSFIPLASCYFSDSQLQLSEDAVRDLMSIEWLITSSQPGTAVQSACEQFFLKYGSHANKGHLHFGGIYRCTSYSHGYEESDMTTVKQLQNDALSVHAGLSYGSYVGVSVEANVSCIKAKLKGNYSDVLLSKTNLEVTITGGPPTSIMSQWRSGLVASNSTWSLIDRGTNTVPVWEIIQMNHKKNFQFPEKLVQTLRHAWEEMTRLCLEPMYEQRLVQEKEVVLEKVKIWNDSNQNPNTFEEQLKQLLVVKHDLVEKLMDFHIWQTLYLSQAPLQEYLRSVMLHHSKQDSEHIKLLMKQLIKPSDMYSVKDFSDVFQWLYRTDETQATISPECADFTSLISILEHVVEAMNLAKAKSDFMYEQSAEQQEVRIKATTTVAQAVNYVHNNLRKANKRYEDLFLVTILFPFNYDESLKTFLHLLSINDLEYLCKELKEQMNEFYKVLTETMKVQAYLCHLAIINKVDVDITEAQTKTHLEYLWKEMKSELDPQVVHVLSRLSSSGCDLKVLKSELSSLVKGIPVLHRQESKVLLDILSGTPGTITTQQAKELQSVELLQGSGSVKSLFERLGLYSQRLTLQDALRIRQETLGNLHEKCTDSKLLPFFILQKIMLHDYRCRTVILQDESISKLPAHKTPSQDSDSGSDTDSDSDTDTSLDEESPSGVHPMDGLLTLLHCSDNFLRQDLMNRLSTCQLAIPFVLPDPFTKELTIPLWAMRSIVKEWRCVDDTHRAKECHIISYSAPIVSFLRFTRITDRSNMSKSKLINCVMSDSKHDFFFHHECEGSSIKHYLMDGLVELCWYLPSGEPTDPFPTVITFTNLRGDAREHPKQTAFLSRVSFMNIVLLSMEDLDEKGLKVLQQLAQAPGGLMLMLDDSNTDKKDKDKHLKLLKESIRKEKYCKIKWKNKSVSDVTKIIREYIKQKNGSGQQFKKITDCVKISQDIGIAVDEDDPECTQGRELASKIQEILDKSPTSFKDDILPLQGRVLWHEWAKHDKELHRHVNRGSKGIEQYNSEKEQDKLAIRKQQFSLVEHLSPVMRHFMLNILNHRGNVRNYFLQWLKLFLDGLSLRKLPHLISQYQEKKRKLHQLQRKHTTEAEDLVSPIKSKLEELNVKLLQFSFGLEHLLRELGQVYEAVVQQESIPPDLGRQVSRLPEVVAELLVEGYPLELMDGDAAHVPIQWVKAVLDKLKEQIGDERIFVLSILGIQGTGKSTLLNTLFGLKFTVSAGRCTRGAFIQLLPLNRSLKETVNYEYMLVVDTEGLHAPEFSSMETHKHDNELATFVIGLADVTLINMFGEAPAEMDDILQTAVHAFLRMKHVKLNSSCRFVHQNVGSMMAHMKGMMGRTKFLEKLDSMTLSAAKQEQCEERYKVFSDVIEFDDEKDVWYFPGLWAGEPPMAAMNPAYSERAQGLKSDLVLTKDVCQCFISDYQKRIQDIWEAILLENFVFSFKNTLEVTAYNRLDAACTQWSWTLQCKMLEWEQQAENRIKSTNISQLTDLYRDLMAELPTYAAGERTRLQDELKRFFEEDKERDTLAQWQRRTELRLNELRMELETLAEHQCKLLISGQRALDEMDKKKGDYRDELIQHVKQLASNLKGRELNDKELEQKYDDKWIEWMTKWRKVSPLPDNPSDIQTSLENYLRQLLRGSDQDIIHKITTESSLRQRKQESLKFKVSDPHIHKSRTWIHMWMVSLEHDHINIAQRETDAMLGKTQRNLEAKRNLNFKPKFCHELLSNLLQNITEAQSRITTFRFTQEYIVDIALTVCGYALPVFEKMADNFRKKNDPIEYLEREMKEPFYRLFKSQYYQRAKEKTAADNLCGILANRIEAAVVSSLGRRVADDMRKSRKCFRTKKALKARILCDLATEGSFCDYLVYLTDVKHCLQTWIKHYTEQHCKQDEGGQKRLVILAELKLDPLVADISSIAKRVTKLNPKVGIKQWLGRFHRFLMKKLTLDLKEIQEIVGVEELNDFGNFTEELCKGLAELNVEKFTSLEDMDHWDKRPYDILSESLIGCCEQCPFCKEQCEYDRNHKGSLHRIALHRPQCLGGYEWIQSCKMFLDICTSSVASKGIKFKNNDTKGEWHPYKKYTEIYPSWSIDSDTSKEASSYWKWFVANHTREIAEYFEIEPTEIPETWKLLRRENVREDLEKLYNL